MGHFHQNRKTKQAPPSDLWEGLCFGDVIPQLALWGRDICFQGGESFPQGFFHPLGGDSFCLGCLLANRAFQGHEASPVLKGNLPCSKCKLQTSLVSQHRLPCNIFAICWIKNQLFHAFPCGLWICTLVWCLALYSGYMHCGLHPQHSPGTLEPQGQLPTGP